MEQPDAGGTPEQTMTVAGPDGRALDATWAVDLGAAAGAARWARRGSDLLAREVAEMAAFFPRWVLVAAGESGPARCARCAGLLVFREGGCRCVRCGRGGTATHLGWVGHLPIPVDGLPGLLARIRGHPHPAHPLAPVGGATLWLVPVFGCYPDTWPHHPPALRYDAALFPILGLDPPNVRLHIVDGTALCLYGATQWRAVTFRVVLQQRVVNHLASLLKIAGGQPPAQAFAGRPE